MDDAFDTSSTSIQLPWLNDSTAENVTMASVTKKEYHDYSLNPDSYSVLIGVSYTLLSIICLAIDIVVVVAMFRAKLMQSGRLFILATVAITDGMIRLSAFAFYFGPSIVLQHNLFDDTMFGPVSFHVTTVLFASFFTGSLTELLIALDRLLTIKRVVLDMNFSEESGLFTRRNTIIYAVTVFPCWVAVTYLMMWLSPCCKGYFTYEYFSLIFEFPTQPYVNVFYDRLDRPMAVVTVIISVCCYILIFAILRRTASTQITDPTMLAKRQREANNCLQFAIAYVFYIALWLTFEALPYLPHDPPYWFTPEIYSAIVECTTTALIQAFVNSKVRNELKKMFRKGNAVHPAGSTVTGSASAPLQPSAANNVAPEL